MEEIIKHPIVILVALALVGASTLVNLKLTTDPNSRPDPFTGTMADDLEGRLHGQIQENRDDIDAIRARIDSIKEAGVAMKLKIAQLEKEVDYLQRHIKSRDGLRWNQPDMVDWIRATEDINEGWRGAIPKHQNIR